MSAMRDTAHRKTRFATAHVHRMAVALRDAALIVVVAALLALGINAGLHAKPIPLVAKKPYEILVPCPVSTGRAGAMMPEDARVRSARTFLVDARDKADFSTWHLPRAMNVTYDYLEPIPKAVMKELAKRAAKSRAKQVVVYGDGENPDSGAQLGKDLSAAGIRNVFYVKGGAPALRKGAR